MQIYYNKIYKKLKINNSKCIVYKIEEREKNIK